MGIYDLGFEDRRKPSSIFDFRNRKYNIFSMFDLEDRITSAHLRSSKRKLDRKSPTWWPRLLLPAASPCLLAQTRSSHVRVLGSTGRVIPHCTTNIWHVIHHSMSYLEPHDRCCDYCVSWHAMSHLTTYGSIPQPNVMTCLTPCLSNGITCRVSWHDISHVMWYVK